MALSLDDISAAPNDPTELYKHLTDRGYLQPPPEAPPLVPPATIGGAMSPVAPPPATVKPMTALTKGPEASDFMSRAVAGAGAPRATVRDATDLDMAQPEMGGQPTGGGTDIGVKPMTPPTLTHTEKMALPLTSPGVPDIGSAAYTRNELERLKEGQQQKPTSAIGKIGHVLGRIGNIAGDILAPGITMAIPGSDLNKRWQEDRLKQELGQRTAAEGQAKNLASEEEARDVQTAEGRQRLEKLQTEQSLEKDAEGNVTGWKDPAGKFHSLDEEGTPQAIKHIAEATTAKAQKPSIEKMDNGDVVAVRTDPKTGKSTSEVVYHGDPKLETEVSQRTIGGQEHKILINKKTGEDIKDLGAFKTEVKPPSLAQELAKEKAAERLVRGVDADGNIHIVPKSQADEMHLKRIEQATEGARKDAENNTSALNEIGVKTRNLDAELKALDQNALQRGIIAKAMSHDTGGAVDSLVKWGVMQGASPQTESFLVAAHNLREAVLSLPKVTTGSSRMTEVQANALWKTIVDASSKDSNYGKKQLQALDEMVGRQWKKVEHVEGNPREYAYPENHKGEGGGANAGPEGPPHEARPGFKWQQNKKTGEYREVPEKH
jgi:hypothetical protein